MITAITLLGLCGSLLYYSFQLSNELIKIKSYFKRIVIGQLYKIEYVKFIYSIQNGGVYETQTRHSDTLMVSKIIENKIIFYSFSSKEQFYCSLFRKNPFEKERSSCIVFNWPINYLFRIKEQEDFCHKTMSLISKDLKIESIEEIKI